jgi:hypothetical protein
MELRIHCFVVTARKMLGSRKMKNIINPRIRYAERFACESSQIGAKKSVKGRYQFSIPSKDLPFT